MIQQHFNLSRPTSQAVATLVGVPVILSLSFCTGSRLWIVQPPLCMVFVPSVATMQGVCCGPECTADHHCHA